MVGLYMFVPLTAILLAIGIPALRTLQEGKGSGAADLPTFSRVLLLEESSEDSANVSIGDLNGDGFPDIVLAKGRHSPLLDRVLFNDGHGRFPTAHDLGDEADRSYSATLVDIDGDGDLDVVVSNDAPDPKRVYANDGKGNFRQISTYGRPEWPTRNAAVADLDGDGHPDIIVANRTGNSGGSNFVCFNKGGGRFDADCLAFSHESATTVTPADVNRDGFIDLIVPNRDGGQSYVYLNDGKARFEKRIPFGQPDAEFRVAAAADLNGDGLIDIVAIDERRGPFICFNRPDMTFSAPVPIATTKTAPYALSVGDLNLDGKIDIVVGHVEAQPVVYFNDGSGQHFTPVPFGDNKGTAYGFAIGDLDRDGYPEIAVARSGAPNVVYFAVPAERNGLAAIQSGAGSKGASGLLPRIDHLVYGTPDLQAGVDQVEKILGVRATPGGQHPGVGTRNALVALGPATYLEIIGPDPEQPKPERPRTFGIDNLTAPRLVAWAAKGDNLDQFAAEALRRGVKLGEVSSGSRKTPQGVLLSWRYTSPRTVIADGIVPFFIDWGQTPHPARTAATGATLVEFRAEHPQVEEVRKMLSELGIDLPVTKGQRSALVAVIQSPRGRVELR